MACYTEEWLLLLLAWEQNPPLTRLVVLLQQYWEKDMPTQQQRRKSERVLSMRPCPYELTKPVGADAVMLTAGHAYSINSSEEGMLLLLPGTVVNRDVFEVQVPTEAREIQTTKLGEVCWTHSVPVNTRVCMYLVGIRFLFELPALS